jgi:hypothetical protein
MFQTKLVEKTKTHIIFSNFLSKSCAVHEMWENTCTVQPDRLQIWCTHFPCWIPKATYTDWVCYTCFPTLTNITWMCLCTYMASLLVSCYVFTWLALTLQYTEHVSKTTCINNTSFNVNPKTHLSILCAAYIECLQLCTCGSLKMSCQLQSTEKGCNSVPVKRYGR